MMGTTLTPMASDVFINFGSGVRQQVSPSVLNSYRITAVSERLSSYVKSGHARDAAELYNLLLSLSRGIDYAVTNYEVPNNAQDLPLLLKQICQRHNDPLSRGVILVLMMSVKNACKQGWFQAKETEELLFLENEIGGSFRNLSDTNIGSSCLHSIIKTVIERFYPRMKMGEILASLEAKPGFRGYNLDFPITKNSVHSPDERICLFVAQVNNLETSTCLISPQQVDFLLNGKYVDRRTNVFMDPGPLMPTNVTPLLKYGTNLLQAVGQFNSPYIVVVAFMSVTPSLKVTVLQDYVQRLVVASDSDSDIIEGPSRISLNCPISYTRIRTPVKGHSCKHHQCFDLLNFLAINSRRPSWRCPHCNQSVCYLDIRVDQNMVKVLKEVGEDVANVVISLDGSWKAVLEDDGNSDEAHDKSLNSIEGSSEQQGPTNILDTIPNVVDLTEDDNEMEVDHTYEIEDRKPFQDNLRSMASDLNSGSIVHQTVVTQLEDSFRCSVHFENGMATSNTRSDNELVGGASQSTVAFLQPSSENHANVRPISYEVLSQLSFSNNLHSQHLSTVNTNASNEYGRFPITSRMVSRTPVAAQALPARSQANSHNSMSTDVDRWQHIPRSHISPLQTSDYHQTTQNRHCISPHLISSALGVFQNPHLQQAPNPRLPQPAAWSSNVIWSSLPLARTSVQQGSAQDGTGQISGAGNSQQTRVAPLTSVLSGQSPTFTVPRSRMGSPLPVNPDGYRTPAADQRGNAGGTKAISGADGLTDLLSEKESPPAGRMRGSVTNQVYSAALNQLMMQQNHGVRPVRPPSNLATLAPIVPSHLQMLIANRNAQVSQRHDSNNSGQP